MATINHLLLLLLIFHLSTAQLITLRFSEPDPNDRTSARNLFGLPLFDDDQGRDSPSQSGRPPAFGMPDDMMARLTKFFNPFGFFQNHPPTSSPKTPATSKSPALSSPRSGSSALSFLDDIGSVPFGVNTIRGEHVCIREQQTVLPPSDSGVVSSYHACRQFRTAYRCIDRVESVDAPGKQTLRIQECCDGFTTNDIARFGCNQDQPVSDLPTALTSNNLSSYAPLLSSRLDQLFDSTILLPPFSVFEELQSESDAVDRLLRQHIIPGRQRDYDLSTGDKLYTKASSALYVSQSDGADGPTTQLNCVPLLSTNIVAKNCVIHTTAKPISPATANIVGTLEKDGRFKTFAKLMSSDIRSQLSGNDSSRYTVFAFTDETFNKLSDRLKDQILKGKGCVKDLVPKHVVRGAYCASSLEQRLIPTIGGSELSIQQQSAKGKSIVRVGNAKVVESDIFATNGIVHVVDDVVLLEDMLSWRDHVAHLNEPFFHALEKVKSDDFDDEKRPVTVFVPEPAGNGSSSDSSIKWTDESVRNHLVKDALVHIIDEPNVLETAAGSKFRAGKQRSSSSGIRAVFGDSDRGSVKRIGCARLTRPSLLACNSVLHFIDKPLPVVQQSLYDFLSSHDDLSRFFTLFKKSGLSGMLSKSQTAKADSLHRKTIFVPVNDGIATNTYKRLISSVDVKNSTAKLDSFLKQYIVDDELCDWQLRTDSKEIRVEVRRTLNGQQLETHVDENQALWLSDEAQVVEAEIQLTDAIVYLIDSTVSPKTGGIDGRGRIVPSAPAVLSHVMDMLTSRDNDDDQ